MSRIRLASLSSTPQLRTSAVIPLRSSQSSLLRSGGGAEAQQLAPTNAAANASTPVSVSPSINATQTPAVDVPALPTGDSASTQARTTALNNPNSNANTNANAPVKKRQKFTPTVGMKSKAPAITSKTLTAMREMQASQLEAEQEAAAAAVAASGVPVMIDVDSTVGAAASAEVASVPAALLAVDAPSLVALDAPLLVPQVTSESAAQRALIRQAQEEHERKAREKKRLQLHRLQMQAQTLAKRNAKLALRNEPKKPGVKIKTRARKAMTDADADDLPPAKLQATSKVIDDDDDDDDHDHDHDRDDRDDADGDDNDTRMPHSSLDGESQVPVSNADLNGRNGGAASTTLVGRGSSAASAPASSNDGASRRDTKPKRPIPALTPAQLVKQNASVGDIVRSGFERDRQNIAKAKSSAANSKAAARTDTHSAADRVHKRLLASQAAAAPPSNAPRLQMVNGRMQLQPMAAPIVAPIVDMPDNSVPRVGQRVTYASYTKRAKAEKWSASDTEKFFNALQQFGTDFSLIEKLFTNRSRRQIKSKFKKEEANNRVRVELALKARVPIDAVSFREKLTAEEAQRQARENPHAAVREAVTAAAVAAIAGPGATSVPVASTAVAAAAENQLPTVAAAGTPVAATTAVATAATNKRKRVK